jgi:capsular exopolysaccharide synthesis family protein
MLKAVAAVEALEREYLQEKDRLSQEREALKDKIIEAREKSVKYDILKRQVDTNKELYNLFVKKMQEVDLTEGVGEGDLRVVESASAPLLPAKPKKKLILLIGLIIGASLGIGSAFLIEYMDRSLKSKEEIEQLTGLPVMSSITFFDKEILVKDWDNYFTNSSFRNEHELFRVLRANIKFSDLKQKSKVVLVTSSQPGEGKTTISARLAINMAASGEKTLLIDGDLRKPNIHKIFELDNKVGLTNLMVEESSNGKYINYNKVKGLDIITCGQVPAQPAELIENSRIKNLIAEFSSQYDRIIIDSPPVATVIDAALLAEMCDGVLLVIDPRSTDRYILKQAQTQIEKVGVRIIGLVLNKITQAGDGYYSYSYYYKNYDYYGSDDQPKKKKRFHRRKKEHKQEITT